MVVEGIKWSEAHSIITSITPQEEAITIQIILTTKIKEVEVVIKEVMALVNSTITNNNSIMFRRNRFKEEAPTTIAVEQEEMEITMATRDACE